MKTTRELNAKDLKDAIKVLFDLLTYDEQEQIIARIEQNRQHKEK